MENKNMDNKGEIWKSDRNKKDKKNNTKYEKQIILIIIIKGKLKNKPEMKNSK